MGPLLKCVMKVKRVSVGQILFLLLFATCGHAMVSGPCSNCHTMHNSQNAEVVSDSGPNAALLTNDCVGCHSSSAHSTYYEMDGTKVPVVLFTGSEPTEYLAGGNFYWVKNDLGNDHTKGHNVFWNEPDQFLDKAPGKPKSTCGTNSCHADLSGVYGNNFKGGCEGCHLDVAHHANDHPNGEPGAVNGGEQGWYRFLSGHYETGVMGYEDGTWEAGLHDGTSHVGETNHNEYLGYVDDDGNSWGFASGVGGLGNTTTAFCTGCHGLFHTEQKDANAMWVRHPSDAVIPSGGEYADIGDYDPLSPVARPGPTVPTESSATVTAGTDMVMCLSCHRPHGSPYPDMLRWDYSRQISGGGDNADEGVGCFYCHTSKDD
ncbi:MAG: hypothetical protein LC645_01200 [Geobacteraceae bacterium]|nr:hypothetical protein [Geobacteraceae bacterium]